MLVPFRLRGIHFAHYNLCFNFKASMRLCAVRCKSINFIASPMFPDTLTLPWKNAFCGFISPLINSVTSLSLIINVTSGLSVKIDI